MDLGHPGPRAVVADGGRVTRTLWLVHRLFAMLTPQRVLGVWSSHCSGNYQHAQGSPVACNPRMSIARVEERQLEFVGQPLCIGRRALDRQRYDCDWIPVQPCALPQCLQARAFTPVVSEHISGSPVG